MDPAIQLLGAVLVLGAFIMLQARKLRSDSAMYLSLNTIGAGVLALDAALTGQPGFLLLEGVWALVAAFALARLIVRALRRHALSNQ